MVIQKRETVLRLIRQHDHAVASGEMAHHWVGFGPGESRLAFGVVLATTLHDYAWRGADEEPRFDPTTRGIHGFETHPLEERAAFYSAGLDEVTAMHAYSGLLGSLHYFRFMESKASPAFLETELARQRRLRTELGISGDGEERLQEDRAWVRLFDNLSLFACLTGPGAVDPPDWLAAEEVGVSPCGRTFSLVWAGDEKLVVDPFPFAGPVPLAIPCRDVPRSPYDERTLRETWNRAPRLHHRVTLVPE